jgi:hypothetical protein
MFAHSKRAGVSVPPRKNYGIFNSTHDEGEREQCRTEHAGTVP